MYSKNYQDGTDHGSGENTLDTVMSALLAVIALDDKVLDQAIADRVYKSGGSAEDIEEMIACTDKIMASIGHLYLYLIESTNLKPRKEDIECIYIQLPELALEEYDGYVDGDTINKGE